MASRAVSLMMFYMIEVRLRASFFLLRDQARLATLARRERAAARINRVLRGMVARAFARGLRRLMFIAREVERRTAETRNTSLRNAALCVTRVIRRIGKRRVMRLRRQHRLAATRIQARCRGVLARYVISC